MTNLPNLQNLLHTTKKVVRHHDELTKIKGEHFNLFSILKIETRENNTHSAFLSELLDPQGCHLQGDKFLKLFLQVLKNELSEEKNLMELFSNSAITRVFQEYSIGRRNDVDKEGGRVDIYIRNQDFSLCIENKIYAADQYVQIERYCNYNPEKNTVVYLTLNGSEPSKESCGELEAGKDFILLSYRKHIVEWLNLCLREVPNLTSVRESINQYILLIKKLTQNLNMKQEQELRETMARYLEEASFIAGNYDTMINDFKNNFRDDVKEKIEKSLGSANYTLEKGLPVSANYSQLWVNINSVDKEQFKFGIESFSGRGHDNGDMFVGLIDKVASPLLKDLESENEKNKWWRHTRQIRTEDGNVINLHHMYTLKILAKPDSKEYQNLLDQVVNQSLKFIGDYESFLPADLFKAEELIS
ncbi:MAG: PD-(D/E)XK nuclease family protein [Salinimicrobium sp.]